MLHPFAGNPARQRDYVLLERATGCYVTLCVPRVWHDDYGTAVRPQQHPDFQGRIVPLRVGMSGNIPLHFYVADFAKILRSVCPDVVYAYHEPYGIATIQLGEAVRTAAPEAKFVFYSSQNIFKRYPMPIRIGEHRVYSCAAAGVTLNLETQSVLRRKGFQGPLTVVPFSFPITPPVSRAVSSGESLRLGFLGRVVPEKGLATILEALALLHVDKLRPSLLVAGTGTARDDLERLATRLAVDDQVSWLGYRDPHQVQAFFEDIDVLVVPSRTTLGWKEQFGRVVIEALGRGVPVIASDSGELPNLVSALGGGWIFSEGSAHSLADLIRHTVTRRDALSAAGAHGRRKVSELFGEQVVTDRLAAALGLRP